MLSKATDTQTAATERSTTVAFVGGKNFRKFASNQNRILSDVTQSCRISAAPTSEQHPIQRRQAVAAGQPSRSTARAHNASCPRYKNTACHLSETYSSHNRSQSYLILQLKTTARKR